MFLKEIELTNYTNYEFLKVSLNQSINLIIGNNAQGKSNLLDSIYYLSMAKSHRQVNDLALVKWEKDYFRIKTEVTNIKGDFSLEFAVKKGRKIVKINGSPIKKLSDLIGLFNTVIFAPDDLAIIKGAPELRRRYLNRELIQVSPVYYENLINYQKILLQRNNLLKKSEKINLEEMDIWDEQLASFGSKIMDQRIRSIKKIMELSNLIHALLTGQAEKFSLIYKPSFVLEQEENFIAEDIKYIFLNKLKKTFKEDLQKGFTKVGPHRDDLAIKINNTDVKAYGSQGQQRTAVLTLKLTELEFMHQETGEYPVLLLDDVFSELDFQRRQFLLKTVSKNIQTFISTTDLSAVESKAVEGAKIFQINNGNII